MKETIGIFEDDDDADLVQASNGQSKEEDIHEDSNDSTSVSALKPLVDGTYTSLRSYTQFKIILLKQPNVKGNSESNIMVDALSYIE